MSQAANSTTSTQRQLHDTIEQCMYAFAKDLAWTQYPLVWKDVDVVADVVADCSSATTSTSATTTTSISATTTTSTSTSATTSTGSVTEAAETKPNHSLIVDPTLTTLLSTPISSSTIRLERVSTAANPISSSRAILPLLESAGRRHGLKLASSRMFAQGQHGVLWSATVKLATGQVVPLLIKLQNAAEKGYQVARVKMEVPTSPSSSNSSGSSSSSRTTPPSNILPAGLSKCQPWFMEPYVLHELRKHLPPHLVHMSPRIYGTFIASCWDDYDDLCRFHITIMEHFVDSIPIVDWNPLPYVKHRKEAEQAAMHILCQLLEYMAILQKELALVNLDMNAQNVLVHVHNSAQQFTLPNIHIVDVSMVHMITQAGNILQSCYGDDYKNMKRFFPCCTAFANMLPHAVQQLIYMLGERNQAHQWYMPQSCLNAILPLVDGHSSSSSSSSIPGATKLDLRRDSLPCASDMYLAQEMEVDVYPDTLESMTTLLANTLALSRLVLHLHDGVFVEAVALLPMLTSIVVRGHGSVLLKTSGYWELPTFSKTRPSKRRVPYSHCFASLKSITREPSGNIVADATPLSITLCESRKLEVAGQSTLTCQTPPAETPIQIINLVSASGAGPTASMVGSWCKDGMETKHPQPADVERYRFNFTFLGNN